MKRLLMSFYILTLLLLPFQVCCAQGFLKEQPTKVTLLSDHKTISAGEPFRLGVLFQIEDGWHIYWKDPGDSGLPTKVVFRLPPAYGLDELQWPRHEEFEQAGGIKGNGYTGEVLLFSEVTTPQDFSDSEPLSVEAEVSWLNCSEKVCVPGKKVLNIDIAKGADGIGEHLDLFNKYSSLLPAE